MNIGQGIFTHLTTDENVAAIVAARVYPNRSRKEEPFPQLVYECKDRKSGTFKGKDRLTQCDITIVAAAQNDYAAVDVLSDAVVASVDRFVGTWGDVTIQGAFVDDILEDNFIDPTNDKIRYFVKEISVTCWYIK